MTKYAIAERVSVAMFKQTWPVCEICRLQFLKSEQYRTLGIEVYKIRKVVLCKLKALELSETQARLYKRRMQLLHPCNKEHRILMRAIKAAESLDHSNMSKIHAKTMGKTHINAKPAINKPTDSFDTKAMKIEVLKYRIQAIKDLMSETIAPSLNQRYRTRVEELEQELELLETSKTSKG